MFFSFSSKTLKGSIHTIILLEKVYGVRREDVCREESSEEDSRGDDYEQSDGVSVNSSSTSREN